MSKTLRACAALAILGLGALLPASGLAAGPWLILNTYSGYPGSAVSVNGFGFAPDEGVLLSIAGGPAGHATTDQHGTFTDASVSVPQKPQDTYTLLVTGDHRDKAAAHFSIAGFYPNAAPSAWYLLPNQPLSFSGTGFAPGENILIADAGDSMLASTTADGRGAFKTGTLTVPFNWENSQRSFTVKGSHSGAATSFAITVGTFYPQMTPSTYWVETNASMNVSGTDFAPGEDVRLLINGTLTQNQTADSSGDVGFTLTTPSSGPSATLTLEGASSDTRVSRTIYLHP